MIDGPAGDLVPVSAKRWTQAERRKRCGGGERKKPLGTSPIIFLFDLGSAIYPGSYIFFTKHERKTHQTNKQTNRRFPTLRRSYKDEQGLGTSKRFFARKWRWWSRDHLSSVNVLIVISICELEDNILILLSLDGGYKS